jgi:hypothetical protein
MVGHCDYCARFPQVIEAEDHLKDFLFSSMNCT